MFINSKAQSQRELDSLEKVSMSCANDTNKVKLLNELAWEFISTDLKKAKAFCSDAIELATTLKFYKGRSSAYNALGAIYQDEAKTDEALKFYFLSLADKTKIHDEKGFATVNSNIGIVYRTKGNYEKALSYYAVALNKRKLLKDEKGEADCYNNMGNVYRDKGQLNEALKLFILAKEIRSKIGDEKGIAFSLNNIGGVYDDQSDFTGALKSYYEASAILEKQNDKSSLVRIYSNISIINRKLKNYPEALKYAEFAMHLSEETGNLAYKISIYDIMGTIYNEAKNYKNARQCFEKGMAIAKESNDKEMQSQFLVALGLLHENNGDFIRAESNYKMGIEIAKEIGMLRSVARYCNSLGELYSKLNKIEQARELLNNSIQISKKNGFKNDLKKSYKIFADLFQNLKDLEKSIQYHKLYEALNDSLYSEGIAQKFAEQQIRYETEKKDIEMKLLKQQEEISLLQLKDQSLSLEKRKYLLIASLLFILSLCFAGYFYFSGQKIKSRQMKEKAVRETEENERLRMAKDIHDDLGSGLSKIKFLSEMISAKSNQNPEIQTSIRSISETSVSLVENMRDLIWALNPENTTLDSLVARIREFTSDYLGDFPIELKMNIAENFDDKKISKEAHRNIFFILKECLQNIVKHANASTVTLKIEVTSQHFKLMLSDNGKGIEKNDNERGNGLRNIAQRAESIGGKAEFVSLNGFSVKLHVPLKEIEKA